MAATMKAVVFHGKGDVRYEDVAIPATRPGWVKIKPAWVGICGTDLHEYQGGCNLCPAPGKPHPITGETVPLIFGHEFSGTIEEIGEGVKGLAVGERVCVEPTLSDDVCDACERGFNHCCKNLGFLGLSGISGGLAEHSIAPAASVHKIPDSMSFEIAAMVEPLAVAMHAVESSTFKPGDIPLVMGAGPIGLAIIQCLKAQGADKIIVSEIAGKRKEFATHFNATHILDPTKDDVVAECFKLTENRGVDVVLDAAGTQKSLDTGFQALRTRGTLVNVAIWGGPAVIYPTLILLKEARYRGIITYSKGCFAKVIAAISQGRIKPEAMITKKIKMEEILEGFRLLTQEKDKQVKILVEAKV